MTFGFFARLASRFRPAPAPAPTTTLMQFNASGMELLKHFESCLAPIGDGKFAAYPDPAHGWKIPTIGWGTVRYQNGQPVKKGDVITQAEADRLLAWEVDEKSDAVRSLVKVPIDDDQFSALVCFAYNVGVGALRGSTLLKLLNAGKYAEAAEQFKRWNKANGKELLGLTRRRLSEQRLFLGVHPAIVSMEKLRELLHPTY